MTLKNLVDRLKGGAGSGNFGHGGRPGKIGGSAMERQTLGSKPGGRFAPREETKAHIETVGPRRASMAVDVPANVELSLEFRRGGVLDEEKGFGGFGTSARITKPRADDGRATLRIEGKGPAAFGPLPGLRELSRNLGWVATED